MKRILSSIVVAILLTLPVSAFCVSLGNYVELNNATEISNVTELRNVQDLGGLESETIAFIARVIADGGTVEDTNFLNSFIVDAKANNYYSDIVAAYSPSWGVKGTTTASKLYCVKGASTDLAQPIGASQPQIIASDLNGKTRLLGDGIAQTILGTFGIATPQTLVIGGLEQITWTDNDRIISDIIAGVLDVRQRTLTPDIALAVPADILGRNSDATIGSSHHYQATFNGLSSNSVINNGTPVTAAITTTPAMTGLSLFASGGAANFANAKGGIFVAMTPAVDGSFAAKMTALYNFSKSVYGTP